MRRYQNAPYSILRRFHLNVRLLAQVLEQVAALKVLVRVHNGLQLVGREHTLVLGLFDLSLMQMLKDAAKVSNVCV